MNLAVQRLLSMYSLPSFERFLRNLEWSLEYQDQTSSIWRSSDGESEVVLPATTALRDATHFISDILETLSTRYRREPIEIVSEYLLQKKNKVKLRVLGQELEGGVIPFAQGLRLLESTRDMLVASYLATNSKKKNYLGSRPEYINEHLEQIELGQTEVGSYIINVFMPLEEAPEKLVSELPLPTRAFHQLEEAADALRSGLTKYAESNDLEVFSPSVQNGVSSNFCFAIGEIGNNGKNDVEIQLEYHSPLQEEKFVRRIAFEKAEISIIQKVGEFFRQDLTEPEYTLIGYVIDLHRERNDTEGEITVAALIGDKKRHVRVHLTYNDYQTAIRAHESSLQIAIIGTLVNQTNRTTMNGISKVEIIERSSSGEGELFE